RSEGQPQPQRRPPPPTRPRPATNAPRDSTLARSPALPALEHARRAPIRAKRVDVNPIDHARHGRSNLQPGHTPRFRRGGRPGRASAATEVLLSTSRALWPPTTTRLLFAHALSNPTTRSAASALSSESSRTRRRRSVPPRLARWTST